MTTRYTVTIAQARYMAETARQNGHHSSALFFHRCATRLQHAQYSSLQPCRLTQAQKLARWEAMPWTNEHDVLCFCVDCMSRASTNNGKGRL